MKSPSFTNKKCIIWNDDFKGIQTHPDKPCFPISYIPKLNVNTYLPQNSVLLNNAIHCNSYV